MESDEQMPSEDQPYNLGDQFSEDEQANRKSEEGSNESQSSEAGEQLTQKQKLQFEILNQAISKEKSTPYQEQITSDLVNKLNDLADASVGKTGQKLINIKIQELVLNKLLVLNYSKSDFRLVLAHYHLGEAYLAYDCIEQAIEHISIAMHKNQQLAEELPKSQMLQINMLIALAQCFMSQNNYDDAVQQLYRAKEVEDKVNDDYQTNYHREEKQTTKNLKILVLKAQCLSKQKNFDEAIDVIDEVIAYTKSKKMAKIEFAFSLVQKANILAEIGTQEKYNQAIEYQQEAINTLVDENYSKPQQVAEMYSTLSGYFQKIGNSESSLTCIQKVRTLYEQLYSPEDKRVIKARRKIATAFLKSERYKQAVTELLEIAKLEEKVFGETLQLARTLKLLGTVYISLQVGDARVYLKRAMNIFQSLGNKKQVLQIKQKLKELSKKDNGVNDLLISEADI